MNMLPLPTQASTPIAGPPSKSPRRVGLLAHGFASWGGGIDFLSLVASSLHRADPALELHVLAPMRGPLTLARDLRNKARRLLGDPMQLSNQPQSDHLKRAFIDTGANLQMIDIGLRAVERATSRLDLDALIPAISPRLSSNVPWVGYIYDFQHKYLPQLFSAEERAKRDQEFGHMLENATALIVNARDVMKDIELYYPGYRAKVFVLPFSPAPSADFFSVEPKWAAMRYKIHTPYFIVCNQFWKHKDHRTAFKAFAIVARQHPNISLVCTGATNDYRFPGYFDDLMQEATRDGVVDKIKVLSLIPKADQMALLRGAVALVQPTLFEGGPGGGAVFDAVAVGQRSIVSDIPVNREIEEPTVSLFEAGNDHELASRMMMLLEETPASNVDKEVLIARGIERRRACGQVLLQALDFVCDA